MTTIVTREPTATPAAAETFPGRFPLDFVPIQGWLGEGRQFNATRKVTKRGPDYGKLRYHAGCDLLAPVGTRIFAVQDGKVLGKMLYFYEGTYVLEVAHTDFMIRYGEIESVALGIVADAAVKQGQHIANVGRLQGSGRSMLHLEMYDPQTGPVRQVSLSSSRYMRSAVPRNPTPYLNAWAARRSPRA
jgi:murein DD-endopeptidase MepM/ murein hydrolase activator NlpD